MKHEYTVTFTLDTPANPGDWEHIIQLLRNTDDYHIGKGTVTRRELHDEPDVYK